MSYIVTLNVYDEPYGINDKKFFLYKWRKLLYVRKQKDCLSETDVIESLWYKILEERHGGMEYKCIVI
jgi:hypothetical protein